MKTIIPPYDAASDIYSRTQEMELEKLKSPYDFFEYFYADTVRLITEQSNLYAVSKHFKQEPITVEELWSFIAIIINSMYMKTNSRRLLWSDDPDVGLKGVKDLMTRNRFDQILRSLHFRNNNAMADPKPDKFYKVRPLFDNLNTKLRIFSNGPNISIDESIVVYFGFHEAKQYIENKPHKYGFKMYVACKPDGTVLYIEPYSGKSTLIPEYGLGKSSDIVYHMHVKRNFSPGCNIFVDNYFMSPQLLHTFSQNKLGLTGTMRMNRCREVPLDKSKIKEKGEFYSLVDKEKNIIYTQWLDRAMVTMGSNNFGCEPLVQIRMGRGTNKKTVYKPTNIFQYNKNMGGVDLLDYFVNVYRPRIRSKKWYWPLFQYSLLLSLHSGKKLYHERSGGEERSTRERSFLLFI